ncbi:hypothetical protein CGLO_17995 [Colletotrichum gloeosporioides Cg-14]|uniref:Uncharacterized protein n=1 Tax=Colletotrichum gloeosporioides (strain Cg-14) TaxID=1237896 RepID=T0KVJ8_COLGC|nr:hypothetical protein CGLO_17995 [Colletotrichum gloeosporioides Cg-14]
MNITRLKPWTILRLA